MGVKLRSGKKCFPNKRRGMKLRSGRRVGPQSADKRKGGRGCRGSTIRADIANPGVNVVHVVPLPPDNVPSYDPYDVETVSAPSMHTHTPDEVPSSSRYVHHEDLADFTPPDILREAMRTPVDAEEWSKLSSDDRHRLALQGRAPIKEEME